MRETHIRKAITYSMPMTPQAQRSPEFPVVKEKELLPLPRSSSPECTTKDRPMMLFDPFSEMILSVIFIIASPAELAWIFPRSPTCLTVSSGAP